MIPYRRVVPAGYHAATLTLTGTSALLMNSPDVDPASDQYRAFTQLSKKRGKSIDDEARLREMEWALRIFLDDELGPFLPSRYIKKNLQDAATKWRKGADIKRSLIVIEHRIPLLYDGPRDQQGLWNAGYYYTALVTNAGAGSGRVRRTRPCFEEWGLECEIAWDPEDLDYDFLQLVVERAQKYGLGDYRPEYGSFRGLLGVAALYKEGANQHGAKPVVQMEKKAHDAAVNRIRVDDELVGAVKGRRK